MLWSKINPKGAKKQLHAEDFKLLEKQETEETGKDYERKQAWGYPAENVERWNEKEETRKEWGKNKLVDKFLALRSPNGRGNGGDDISGSEQTGGGILRDAHSTTFLTDAQARENPVDRMEADVAKQMP
ncbi:hypothetical protein KI688_004220 [Linnemannia hyalina]|uniref:Uncharacterized protein n=1 Tax=Linnemannia hyalina TaxID=64524 RepID=A0A9P8BPN2_9FUNG|nr:hypothetical protein KI688_004220 [Linnemannia hyalina]